MDRRTDSFIVAIPCMHSCSTVKINTKLWRDLLVILGADRPQCSTVTAGKVVAQLRMKDFIEWHNHWDSEVFSLPVEYDRCWYSDDARLPNCESVPVTPLRVTCITVKYLLLFKCRNRSCISDGWRSNLWSRKELILCKCDGKVVTWCKQF